MKVTVERKEPAPPPIDKVILELTLDEARHLVAVAYAFNTESMRDSVWKRAATKLRELRGPEDARMGGTTNFGYLCSVIVNRLGNEVKAT